MVSSELDEDASHLSGIFTILLPHTLCDSHRGLPDVPHMCEECIRSSTNTFLYLRDFPHMSKRAIMLELYDFAGQSLFTREAYLEFCIKTCLHLLSNLQFPHSLTLFHILLGLWFLIYLLLPEGKPPENKGFYIFVCLSIYFHWWASTIRKALHTYRKYNMYLLNERKTWWTIREIQVKIAMRHHFKIILHSLKMIFI